MLFATVPALEPSTRFNSAADDVTSEPANLRPPSTKSWEAISRTWFPPSPPIVTLPLAAAVTALLASDVPSVVISK